MHTVAQADPSSISNYQEANLPSQCEKVECMHSPHVCEIVTPKSLQIYQFRRNTEGGERLGFTGAVLTGRPTSAVPKAMRISDRRRIHGDAIRMGRVSGDI